MPEAAYINPKLLAWARETAGLSLEEAAAKLGLKDTARATGAQKLSALETGERAVSDAQLQKFATVYRRPLITFYLPEPPQRGDRGEDFRTLPGIVSARENALLDAMMRDVRARQQMLREVLLEDEAMKPLPFVASAKMEQGPRLVAEAIRNTLAVTEEQQKAAKDAPSLFTLLRTAAERAGVFVLLLGDLGSHHSDISEEVFRGFALADDIAPFVVINDNDAVTARAFTLMHELAHIWIGASGVSGPVTRSSANAIERFCNTVAGEFLLPPAALAKLPDLADAGMEVVLVVTERVATEWNVSQAVVTYRLLSERRIEAQTATSLFQHFAERWRKEKQRSKESGGDGGPSYYIVRRHRLGAALLNTVRRALQEEALTPTRAAKILGVSPTSVNQLLHERPRAA